MAYLDSVQKGGTTYRLCDPNTAAEFSAAVAYAAGEYVNYDGTLYKFTADHAAGAWTGTDAAAVKLAEDVGGLKSALASETLFYSGNTNLFDKEKATIGKTLDGSGNVIVSATAFTSDFIPVFPGKTIYSSKDGASTNFTTICFYDKNKTVISYLTTVPSCVIPASCMYIRMAKYTTTPATYIDTYKISYSDDLTYSEYGNIETLIEAQAENNQVAGTLDTLIEGVAITWNDGYALATNGAGVSHAGYSTSDYIKLDKIVKTATFVNLRQRISYTIVPICFYTGTKSFIGYYTDSSLPNNSPVSVKIADIISNYQGAAYIKVGKSNSDSVSVEAYTMPCFDERIAAIGNTYPPYNIAAYPKILCCGDSVTYGFVVEGTQADPAQIYAGMPSQSYPACIGRMYGNDITTEAQSGITIKQFYENKYPSIDFTGYDLVLLELGLNPGNEGYLNVNDMNTSGTSTYLYSQMVQAIRAQNQNMAIVLIRSPLHIGDNGLAALNAIAESVNGYVIDLADTKYINLNDTKYHGWYDNDGAAAFDDTHFTRTGYAAKAYAVVCWLGELLPS